MRRILVVSLLAAAAAGVVPAAAAAQGAQPQLAGSAAVAQGRLAVKVDVARFRATRSGPVDDGVATATLRGLGQLPTTVRKKVTLSAARSGSCTILTLTLESI